MSDLTRPSPASFEKKASRFSASLFSTRRRTIDWWSCAADSLLSSFAFSFSPAISFDNLIEIAVNYMLSNTVMSFIHWHGQNSAWKAC